MNGSLNQFPNFTHLQLANVREDMFFAGEIVEKGSLADIRLIGNVFHGGRRDASFGKKAERCADDSVACLYPTPFAPIACFVTGL